MKKLIAISAFFLLAIGAQAQQKSPVAQDENQVQAEKETGDVLELRYIKVPVEHTENSIMVDGKKYGLWPSKPRAEHIYNSQYKGKDLGRTIIYVRSDEEKDAETIRFDQ